jgi:hypothetical protein
MRDREVRSFNAITGLSWNIYPIPPGPVHTVTPDASGWYPVLPKQRGDSGGQHRAERDILEAVLEVLDGIRYDVERSVWNYDTVFLYVNLQIEIAIVNA